MGYSQFNMKKIRQIKHPAGMTFRVNRLYKDNRLNIECRYFISYPVDKIAP